MINYQLKQLKQAWSWKRKQSQARALLRKLELSDETVIANANKASLQAEELKHMRASLRNNIIALGPDVILTVLKHSRHEGSYYREEVYTIMQALSNDLIALFTEGLFHKDAEISWSCIKWLRDKAQADPRTIKALIQFAKNPLHKTHNRTAYWWALEPLENWGEPGCNALMEIIGDKSAAVPAREAAIASFPLEHFTTQRITLLRTIALDSSEASTIRGAIDDKLNEVLS